MPDELRHAYRALLRATTYLPDSAARTYIHNYAVHRFRSVAHKIHSKNGDSAKELVARYHDREKIRKVWQASRQLERAAQGNVTDLQKVLYLTYGRVGKRRRELVQQLLEPEEDEFPKDQAALEALIQKPPEREQCRHHDNKKLQAFIKSQRFNHPIERSKAKLKVLAPKIPETNVWGRPVPLKLQASIKRRYWADTLERILPPVPRHEWDRLRDLATGAIPIDDPPPRRSRPLEVPPEIKLLEYFTLPTNRHNLDIEGIEVEEDSVSMSLEKNPNTRGLKHLTPRFMRRLYATIWSMTPTMSQDEITKIWTTKWGGARSAAHTGQITAPSAKDMELFEGATEQVKPSHSRSRQQKREQKQQKKISAGHRPAPKVPLGDEGYTQGVVPVI